MILYAILDLQPKVKRYRVAEDFGPCLTVNLLAAPTVNCWRALNADIESRATTVSDLLEKVVQLIMTHQLTRLSLTASDCVLARPEGALLYGVQDVPTAWDLSLTETAPEVLVTAFMRVLAPLTFREAACLAASAVDKAKSEPRFVQAQPEPQPGSWRDRPPML